MQLVARQIYGTKKGSAVTYNTFIGGVSDTIGTASLLATKLGISVGAISNFTVVGSDIKCFVTGAYALPGPSFFTNSAITYFIDDVCTSIVNGAFSLCPNLKKVYAKSVTSLSGYEAFKNSNALEEIYLDNCVSTGTSSFSFGSVQSIGLKIIYIPRCTNLGGTALNNNVFVNTAKAFTLYVNSSLSTNNGGAPDGDLVGLPAGTIIRYVTNFTAPSAITTLAAGTIYNTAVQLNFTAPSSTNAIDYYECYVDGVYKNKITASGQYIIGLTASTSYNITLIAVDVFYNKSVVSNTVTQSTNTTSAVPTTGLVSYYKLDSNSNDSFGANNGVDTSITYAAGKVGNSASFNGTSSLVKMAYASFGLFGTQNMTFNAWIKLNALPAARYDISSIQSGTTAATQDKAMYVYPDGSIAFYVFDGAQKVCRSTAGLVAINNWYMVTGSFNGTTLKIYLNGVLRASLAASSSYNETTPTLVLGHKETASNYFNGFIDEFSIYNLELTQTQIDIIYNSGNGTTL